MSIFSEKVLFLFVLRNGLCFMSPHRKEYYSKLEHLHMVGNAIVEIYFKLKQGITITWMCIYIYNFKVSLKYMYIYGM